MSFEKYQEWCNTKWKTDNSQRDQVLECALGFGESGESQGTIKKWLFHGHDYDEYAIKDEMGDQLYYIVQMCNILGFSINSVIVQNIVKLNERYPNGFESKRSINRDD
jgi:NTP pyrophosphatase (non-canonical NTP hydrolase)